MMRNKELRHFLALSTGLVVVASITILFYSYIAAIVIAIVGIVLILLFVHYTNQRYKDIHHLSHNLRKMMEGEYRIDVRNNEEGELSILRNELFKMTTRQYEQHDYMSNDRVRMAEALADISHQLKTPLTSIQMMVDLLEDDQLPSNRRQQFMGNIQSQLQRMDWLVKVLLKLSKLDSGTVTFYKNYVSLATIVSKAVHAVQVSMSDKQITLIKLEEPAPLIVADEKWIHEAVTNIVKNAVEHTPEQGTITVSWDDNPIVTSLTIHNSGEPIAKEDLLHLFKRFYKGKHASDTSVGIGLSLSLQIMESHNGTIEVSSEADKGTRFIMKWYKGK